MIRRFQKAATLIMLVTLLPRVSAIRLACLDMDTGASPESARTTSERMDIILARTTRLCRDGSHWTRSICAGEPINKKSGRTYKYYLTRFGRVVSALVTRAPRIRHHAVSRTGSACVNAQICCSFVFNLGRKGNNATADSGGPDQRSNSVSDAFFSTMLSGPRQT